MRQEQLFQDVTDWLTALAADVDAAGGCKIVGHQLWSDLDPDTAGRKLANALNAKQKQDLKYGQIRLIKKLARNAVGRSQLHVFESGELACDLKWITLDDMAERAQKRVADLMQHLQAELQRSNDLMAELKARAQR